MCRCRVMLTKLSSASWHNIFTMAKSAYQLSLLRALPQVVILNIKHYQFLESQTSFFASKIRWNIVNQSCIVLPSATFWNLFIDINWSVFRQTGPDDILALEGYVKNYINSDFSDAILIQMCYQIDKFYYYSK